MRKFLLILILFASVTSDAQSPIHKLLRKRPVAANYLLDDYPSAAAAYSLRKLNSAYAGDCLRVRRLSDNTEQDIGFAGDVLDESSLLSFVGAGDGVVVKWYDQSGNGVDAAITSNFPVIVDDGAVVESNGKPTVDFGTNANARYLSLPTGFLNGATTLSYFQVAEITAFGGSNAGVFGPSNTGGVGLEVLQHDVISRPSLLRMNGTARNNDGGAAFQLWNNATQTLTSIFGNSTDVAAYKNSAAVSLTSSAAMPALNFNGVYGIGQYNSATNIMYGKISELVIWLSDETANRTGIEGNINSFYSTF